ncbi:hypothetical protein ACJX0J_041613, partial [Zea mays]
DSMELSIVGSDSRVLGATVAHELRACASNSSERRNLAKNNFSGNLPYSISNLVSLEYLEPLPATTLATTRCYRKLENCLEASVHSQNCVVLFLRIFQQLRLGGILFELVGPIHISSLTDMTDLGYINVFQVYTSDLTSLFLMDLSKVQRPHKARRCLLATFNDFAFR